MKERPVTLLLVGSLVVMFGVTLALGGATPSVLMKLGARRDLMGFPEENWRLLASMFLHYGWVHFLVNTAFLAVVAGLLEPLAGRFQTLYLFLFTGFAANLAASELAWQRPAVGASGAVLGLTAALLVLLLRGWGDYEPELRKKMAMMLGSALALSMFPDPRVDLTAHGAGMLLGGLYAAVLPRERGWVVSLVSALAVLVAIVSRGPSLGF